MISWISISGIRQKFNIHRSLVSADFAEQKTRTELGQSFLCLCTFVWTIYLYNDF